jgi:hypothetical protein
VESGLFYCLYLRLFCPAFLRLERAVLISSRLFVWLSKRLIAITAVEPIRLYWGKRPKATRWLAGLRLGHHLLATGQGGAFTDLTRAADDREAAQLQVEQLQGKRIVGITQRLAFVGRPKVRREEAEVEAAELKQIAQRLVVL